MLRIKMGDNLPLDSAKAIQSHFINARKYPERHFRHINGTVQIKKGLNMKKTQFYHVWLILPDVE